MRAAINGAILLLALLLSSCAGHQKVPWTTANKLAFAAALGGQTLDVASTRDGLSRGCYEMNPLLGRDPSTAQLIGLKALGLGFAYIMIEYMSPPEDRQLYRTVGYSFFGAIGSAAAIHNYNLDCP